MLRLIMALCLFACLSAPSQATVITGTIMDWPESGQVMEIGDGINMVHMWWSINTTDRGFFYGSGISNVGNTSVAHAVGVTAVEQIVDASIFTYVTTGVGPLCDADCDPDGVGEFVAFRSDDSGHFGILRIDDISGVLTDAVLDATWWFQTDGSGNFNPATALDHWAQSTQLEPLLTAAPNPFRTSTTIEFQSESNARIDIVDLSGRIVRVLTQGPDLTGRSGIQWDGTDRAGDAVASGVYFIRLVTGTHVDTHKLLLVR